jgi:hypothetical protein
MEGIMAMLGQQLQAGQRSLRQWREQWCWCNGHEENEEKNLGKKKSSSLQARRSESGAGITGREVLVALSSNLQCDGCFG